MSHPRAKRPFAGAAADPAQRQITSFAGVDAPPPPPRLPSAVQADLLSVGMRVRKSVPEGYKTAARSAFRLLTDATPAPHRAPPTELLPFCGLNKVGGLAAQPAGDVPPPDAVPDLSISQESVASADPLPPSRKRLFPDDDDDDGVPTAWARPAKACDGDVSPHSLAPVGWGSNARVMAVPRPRVSKGAPLAGVGQENMVVDSEFDEADFLIFGEAKDMDTSR